ncbi:hypothetical protein VQ042_12580 [Aurantimonas sp. A2-1-M11]|uniref:hypothetical protein n=1 Tax=Aurantimonas sp. A2-1-M11 TaxID=3113712 RepID=UPI002F92449A
MIRRMRGYQNFYFSDRLGFHYGFEVGGAGRFGDNTSGELWSGIVLRHEGVSVADSLHFSPSLTVGLSAVTETVGREARNEIMDGGDATILFYLGPEISVSLSSARETELFWRLHHRSGAGGTLGDMRGAANANVFGFRSRF